MERNLIILRGVPGSGKSTVAFLFGGMICCTDDYFTDADGNYNWNLEEVGIAHKTCQVKCEDAMKNNQEKIIIANTNTTDKEMKPYEELAKEYNYKVFYLVIENRHGNNSLHNVPEETITKMSDRLRNSIKLK